MMRVRTGWINILGVIAVLWLLFWLGLRGLNADAIWSDEHWTVLVAGGGHFGPISPTQVLTRLAEQDALSPPLYPILLNLWGDLVGWTHGAARALSLLAGVLAAAWTYRLGADLFGRRVGLYALVALSVSAFYMDYLHEMRSYTLFTLFAVMSLWGYVQLLRKLQSRVASIVFVIGLAGMIYTHYFTVFGIATLGLYHLLFVTKNRAWWRPVLLALIAGSLFLPWATVPIQALRGVDPSHHSDLVARRLPLDVVLRTLAFTVGNGSVALLAILLAIALTSTGHELRLLVFWTLVTVILMLGLNAFTPFIIHLRYFLLIWPTLMIFIGLGIERLARTRVTPILTLVVWCAAGLWLVFDPTFILSQPGAENHIPWPTFSAIIDVLSRQAGPDDLVMFHVEPPGKEWLSEQVLDYYLYDYPFRHQQFERLPGLLEADDYFREAQIFIGDASFVWTAIRPDVPGTYHVAEFKRALMDDFISCGTVLDQPETPLELYARVPSKTSLRFEEGIGVSLLKPLSDTASAELPVTLGWQTNPSVPQNTYSVGLHVTDSAGNLVVQADYSLPSERTACRYTVVPLNNLPPGDYQLMVTIYNWATGKRLPGENVQTGEVGDRLWLATITMSPPLNDSKAALLSYRHSILRHKYSFSRAF